MRLKSPIIRSTLHTNEVKLEEENYKYVGTSNLSFSQAPYAHTHTHHITETH